MPTIQEDAQRPERKRSAEAAAAQKWCFLARQGSIRKGIQLNKSMLGFRLHHGQVRLPILKIRAVSETVHHNPAKVKIRPWWIYNGQTKAARRCFQIRLYCCQAKQHIAGCDDGRRADKSCQMVHSNSATVLHIIYGRC